jgi:hypothetical protein
MPKSILFSWVKNANNLSIRGRVESVLLSPVCKKSIQSLAWLVGKVPFIQLSIPFLSTYFSTWKYSFPYLLNSFYTHNPQGLLLRPLHKNLKKGNNKWNLV